MLTDQTCIISITERLHFTVFDISLIHMRKSRGPRIGPCGTPLDTHVGWENAFPRLTKIVLFMAAVF